MTLNLFILFIAHKKISRKETVLQNLDFKKKINDLRLKMQIVIQNLNRNPLKKNLR